MYAPNELTGGCVSMENSTDTIIYYENTCNFNQNCPDMEIKSIDAWNRVEKLRYECNMKPSGITLRSLDLTHFPNLREMNLSALNTPKIDVVLGSNQETGVIRFDASHNQLQQSPSYTIYGLMPHLRHIDLSFNQITKLRLDDFKGATNLSTINYSHNGIGGLEPGVFGKMPNLTKIDLCNNYIIKLDADTFKANTKLEYVDLSGNQIDSMIPTVFHSNRNLMFLNLRNNPLKSFSYNIFAPSTTAIDVYLPVDNVLFLNTSCGTLNCSFRGFRNEEKMENLQYFIGIGNHFENITKVLSQLGSNLRNLELSFCSVGMISNNMLSRFIELRTLRLNHANITRMEMDTFRYQVKLQVLDLSFNRLIEVDTVISSHKFQFLTDLNLEGNQLTKIVNIVPESFPQLKMLAISKNNFSCDYLQTHLAQWENTSVQLINNPSKYQTNVDGIDCYQFNDFFSSPRNLIIVFSLVIIVLLVVWMVIFWCFCECKRSSKKTIAGNMELNNRDMDHCGAGIRCDTLRGDTRCNGSIRSGTIFSRTLLNDPFINEPEYSQITETTVDEEHYAEPVDYPVYGNMRQHSTSLTEPQFNQPYATVDVSQRTLQSH